ncbi:MAG TPA: hypothetical protein V6D27_16930 [Vampirovibrionales bacterium]
MGLTRKEPAIASRRRWGSVSPGILEIRQEVERIDTKSGGQRSVLRVALIKGALFVSSHRVLSPGGVRQTRTEGSMRGVLGDRIMALVSA